MALVGMCVILINIVQLAMVLQNSILLASASLSVGFYNSSCPSTEDVVRQTVGKAIARNPGLGAGLIRMHFHDCFVRGCDASVLLDTPPGQGQLQGEKDHPANNQSLRGFEVIDEAKSLIEARCPQKVSCSDILTFAARDSAYILGGIDYAVPAGRRDGSVSLLTDVDGNIPSPRFKAQQIIDIFASKGLSVEDLVTLSGAHSIGVSHCSFFSERLYNFNATHAQDPSLDRSFGSDLKRRCPAPPASSGTDHDPTVPLDTLTPTRLDNRYYQNLKDHRVLFTSDQTLYDDSPLTASLVEKKALSGSRWAVQFGSAMQKMGSLDVLTGNRGQIRKNCRVAN